MAAIPDAEILPALELFGWAGASNIHHPFHRCGIFPRLAHHEQEPAAARRMHERRWMVITGVGDGIMGAGQAGASQIR